MLQNSTWGKNFPSLEICKQVHSFSARKKNSDIYLAMQSFSLFFITYLEKWEESYARYNVINYPNLFIYIYLLKRFTIAFFKFFVSM